MKSSKWNILLAATVNHNTSIGTTNCGAYFWLTCYGAELKVCKIFNNWEDIVVGNHLYNNFTSCIHVVFDIFRVSCGQNLKGNEVSMDFIRLICYWAPCPAILNFFTRPFIMYLLYQRIENELRKVYKRTTFIAHNTDYCCCICNVTLLYFFVKLVIWNKQGIGKETGLRIIIGGFTINISLCYLAFSLTFMTCSCLWFRYFHKFRFKLTSKWLLNYALSIPFSCFFVKNIFLPPAKFLAF